MHPKIESNLLKEKSGVFASQIQSHNTTQVVFELKGSDESYIKSLEDSGAIVEAVHKNLVQARVPPSQAQAMSEMPFVDYVRSPMRPHKDVVSEGVGVINASVLQNLGFNGSGVKIAILDMGFANYPSKLGIELPSNVTNRSFRNDSDITGGGEVHGTAVAEIVYDVAPGAQLYLINFDTEVEFANAVDYAISQNVDVISMSVSWLPGPYDGTGFIDDIVNNATSRGIVWINSAGNYAQSHWEGRYKETTITVGTDTWLVHDFGSGDETNSFSANAGDTIVAILSWNDWPHSSQDYDLILANENARTLVDYSGDVQNDTQEPSEIIEYPVQKPGQYGIIIRKYDATKPVDFELYFMSYHHPQYNVPESSLALPADRRDVIAVGATLWSNDGLELFSSQGPTNDGRTKPDLVAPDGVSTSTYGPGYFYGTSASAPHVAGAAALLLGINPSLTNESLRVALESTAKDLETPGKDNLTGSGRIDILAAYRIPPTVTANSPIDMWVKNGTILHMNASITSISSVSNVTVNVTSINSTMDMAVLVKNTTIGFWINDSIAVDTSNSGLQNLTITVYDDASNRNDAVNMTVKVDNVPPNVTISSPVNNSIVNTQNITILGNVTDNFVIACGLLEHSWQGDISDVTPSGGSGCGTGGGDGGYLRNLSIKIPVTLHEGWNRIILNYTDIAGNYGTASVNVTLDTIPPAVTNLSLSTSTPEMNDPVNITVNVSDIHLNISSIVISVRSPDGYMNTSQMNGSIGSYYYNFANTSEYGRYDVAINVSDNASNINNSEKTWFVTRKSHSSEVSIRGGGTAEMAYGPKMWNGTNFPGLVINEELNAQNMDNSSRMINKSGLFYNTSAQPKKLNVVKEAFNISAVNAAAAGLEKTDAGQTFENGNYLLVGWQGQRYVALNSKIDKLTKLILEQETDDTKNLAAGETWNIGEGWALKLNSTDTNATPAQAWFILSKEGIEKDNKIVSAGTQDAKPIYTYVESNISGENDVPLFVTYAANITKGNVQLKYTWTLSTSVTQINSSDTYGVFKNANVAGNTLYLRNDDTSITLSKDSIVNLMDDLYFGVTSNNSIEYYPFFTSIPPTQLDATENTDVALDILTNTSEDGSIELTKMADIPPGMNRSFALTPFGKYIEINASDNIKNNLTWIKLKLYYTKAELDASGLDESSLKISWYNDSSDRWETLTKGSPAWVNDIGVDTKDEDGYAGYVWANISHLSTFALVGSYPSAQQYYPPGGGGPSTGGGGGGGGGTSGENFSNIELKEKYDGTIFKDKVTTYMFRNASNPIVFVNITGNVSAGLITTMVEVLRGTSTLVKETAPGKVYKNVNVWVGTSGFAVPKNIKDAAIMFRVENAWLESNSIATGDIKMARWDKTQWVQLETLEKDKDGTNTYFEAKTDSFSPLAITGIKGEAMTTPEATQPSPAPTGTSAQPVVKPPINLTLILGVVNVIGIVIVVYLSRKVIFRK